MPEPGHNLPPLGERVPAVRARRSLRPRTGLVVGGLAAAAGLVTGIFVGAGLQSSEPIPSGGPVPTSVPTIPATTSPPPAAVPPECVDAMRSAEQALRLLEQGLETVRRLKFEDAEGLLAEMQRLRSGFSGRVQACLDRAGG